MACARCLMGGGPASLLRLASTLQLPFCHPSLHSFLSPEPGNIYI